MDKDTQATLKGVELAESLGIPMVIMEPVKGGSLAELPDDITSIFRNIRPQASTPSWALRYVATFSNVKVVLSGMSNMEQVEDNLKTFTDFEPLNEAEQEAVCQVADALQACKERLYSLQILYAMSGRCEHSWKLWRME